MAAHTKNLGCFSYSVDIKATELANAAQKSAEKSIVTIGETIRQRSTAIAPLRDGGLIGSARVSVNGTSAVISYNMVYAHYQHEGVNFRHPNGRQAKYLEKVMNDPATAQMVRTVFAQNLK